MVLNYLWAFKVIEEFKVFNRGIVTKQSVVDNQNWGFFYSFLFLIELRFIFLTC